MNKEKELKTRKTGFIRGEIGKTFPESRNFPWRVNKDNVAAVKAIDVSFGVGSAFLRSFGCGITGKSEKIATASEDFTVDSSYQELKFVGDEFFLKSADNYDKPIAGVGELILTQGRKIWASDICFKSEEAKGDDE